MFDPRAAIKTASTAGRVAQAVCRQSNVARIPTTAAVQASAGRSKAAARPAVSPAAAKSDQERCAFLVTTNTQ